MLKKGLVQVYTGPCDEAGFPPLGLSLRAAGHGFRTHLTSFFRDRWTPGVMRASALFEPNLVIDRREIEQEKTSGGWDQAEIREINRAFEKARDVTLGGDFDMVILNGINPILSAGVIPFNDVSEFMAKRPDHVELVFSGAKAGRELIERADLVTEVTVRKGKMSDGHKGGDLVHPTEVITGDGKGKTTYCLGKAMVMSSMDTRSLIIQFIKSPKEYGEVTAIKKLPHLKMKTMGEGFLSKQGSESDKKHREAAGQAWEECLREVFSLEYGLVVLDEINVATHYGLVDPERVMELLSGKPEKVHFILSGRNAHPEVVKAAGSIVEMKEIKHPYKKGIKARKGIEF